MNCFSRHSHLCLLIRVLVLVAIYAPVLVPRAEAIPCISGFMRDVAGNPIVGGDLDFNISATGERIITPGDNTDINGFFTVCVLPNIYDVAFAPPANTHYLGQLIREVDLTSEAGLEMDIVLESGLAVSGIVQDPDGLVVFDVDIDVDRVEGGRLYTPGDNTDLAGQYWVVVPVGEYDFRYEPPRGSRWMGAEIDSVLVVQDMVLDVVLEAGLILQGNITDNLGEPAEGVDIDLRDLLTGEKIFLANNTTDPAGDYIVSAPVGTYQLRFVPPRQSHLVAADTWGFQLGDDTVKNQVLGLGHLVTVKVVGTGGIALAGADLDVKDPLTGSKLFTPHDRANAEGEMVAVVPSGSYNFIIDPPPGVSYAGALLENVAVVSDTLITVTLAGSPRVTMTGRVVNEAGTGIAGAAFSARLAGTSEVVDLTSEATGPTGFYSLDVPPVLLDFTLAPPPGSRLVGRRFNNVSVANDTTWSDIVLATGWLTQVIVRGSSGRAIVGADLDFFDQVSGEEIFTPWDNTNESGSATVALPSGNYRLVVSPPLDSGFQPTVLTNLTVSGDLNVIVELELKPFSTGGVELTLCNPNPFHDRAGIVFRLQSPAEVTLDIFDLHGRLIKQVSRQWYPEGSSSEAWDGLTSAGARAPSGSYIVLLRSPLGQDSQRLTLVR